MAMGFDYQSAGQPDINLRRQPLPQPMPAVGYPGGNVRPPMPDGRGGGTMPSQGQMPSPNAQALANANPNARFMRTDAQGNQFANNPAGQRPGPNQNAMDNANPQANFLRALQGAMVGGQGEDPEMRRRRMMEEMRRRGMQGGGGQMGAPSGGIYAGYPPTQVAPTPYPDPSFSIQQPQTYTMGPDPLRVDGGAGSYGGASDALASMNGGGAYGSPTQPTYSFPAAPLPAPYQDPRQFQSMYNLISPFQ
jgi:hypothetical protein